MTTTSKIVFPSTRTDELAGPLQDPQKMLAQYAPVDCNFTDDLEFLSVKKVEAEVSYWSEEAARKKSIGLIDDIRIVDKEELLIMSNGDKIRLDRISKLRILNQQ